jgi:hypothetical protein
MTDDTQHRPSAGLAFLALGCVGLFAAPAQAEEADEQAKSDIVSTPSG